nr:hypothetical protein [Tanacetum cinerariifolium]
MISDAIKKKERYKYYMAKKLEKNVPNKLKKDIMPRKTRSLTIIKEAVVGSANETDDADESDMDLLDDNPDRDDDNVRYGVFMHNKSKATPNSTYLSLTITSSSLGFIQTLLDEKPAYELMDFMSHRVYTDGYTTSVVHNPEGNPELTSYISGAFEVPFGTHVNVLSTKTLMQEMFPVENAHHIPSLPAKKNPYPTTYPLPSSLQAKAKKLMQKAKKNIWKFLKKEGFQAKVLTEIKKLLPTHISNAIANYVKPRLNTFVLENKSNDTHKTHQQLYDTLYECIILDQDALVAQDAEPSFHKRSHDNQDPPNNPEEENEKKRQKDVGEPSSRSSRQNRSLVVIVQDDTPQCYQKLNGTVMSLNPDHLNDTCQKVQNYILASTTMTTRIKDRIPERWSKEVRRYPFEALNGIHHWEENRIDFFKEGISALTKGNVFSDLRINSFVRIDVKKKQCYAFLTSIIVRRFDDKEYEFSYSDLPRLRVNDVEDMYLLQLSEVKKFSDGTLMKIQENLIDMVSKNKLGSDNKNLKGRDWTNYDVRSSKETLKKINEVLRHREQLRRLEEYVGGRPKTINLCTFVRPL